MTARTGRPTAPSRRALLRGAAALGPAFVASIAYVDPGNVAANLTAGAAYGYLLVWVLVAANLIAVLVQYLSAKLGVVTGRTLPELLADRLPRGGRIAFWLQAEVVAAATDVAELIGGAIALNLLFGLPLVVGGVVVGAVSFGVLLLQTRGGQRAFEAAIVGLLVIIAVGFTAGLTVSPVDWGRAAEGLLPRFAGPGSVLLAASMLGATVMPHAIYLHSALARDRHGRDLDAASRRRLVRITRADVGLALLLAGAVNIAMLLLAAASLRTVGGTDTIAGAYTAIVATLGPAVGIAFAIGLLASGLASTSVGAYAGAVVMSGLLRVHVPVAARRVVTMVPGIAILALGVDPTRALVISQVVLSFGIPFVLVPLVRLTGRRSLMGDAVNPRALGALAWIAAAAVIVLNVALIALTVTA